MTTVVVVGDAEAQLREVVDWWLVNRPAAPLLPLDEFERCTTLLMRALDLRARRRAPRVRLAATRQTRRRRAALRGRRMA